jgi:hypothetical protein
LNIGHKYLSSSYGNEFFLLLKLAFKVWANFMACG